jgi:redox-sensitive bicupin YhaK (pirin superfamily)
LPRAEEEREPSFAHHAAARLPRVEQPGVSLTIIAGTAYGRSSPVEVFSPTLYVDARLAGGAWLEVESGHEQRACYVAQGSVDVGGRRFDAGTMVVLDPAAGAVAVRAAETARVMLAGGAALDGPRHVYWNFVSSSRERIDAAKRDWRERRFAAVPGDDERIPLPDE